MSADRAEALRRWALKNGYRPTEEADPEPQVEVETTAETTLPDTWRVDTGECIAAMKALPAESVDAIVTDPPYGLGFMGKAWDALPPGVDWAEECLRVLKPGGHLLAFGGTRTYHRLACAIEDGGFEIRDTVAWLYGSGFPKSLDVSKAIDKAAGAEREVVGPGRWNHVKGDNAKQEDCLIRPGGQHEETAPATADAQRWSGWGTALKPAHEPVVVARKPLIGTVAVNVLEHGTGALNVDGCRIGTEQVPTVYSRSAPDASSFAVQRGDNPRTEYHAGRWPANLILDEEAAALLDEQTGELKSGSRAPGAYTAGGVNAYGQYAASEQPAVVGDSGGASRFFYVAKASKRERNAGVDKNSHPTVKPVSLMRYLCRLVTPPGGLVLDPFTGSGTTGIAATAEGFRFLGFELDPDYAEIARARIAHWAEEEAA